MKTIRWIMTFAMIAAVGIAVLGVAGCKKSEQAQGSDHAVKYTCSMHPEVVQDKPGNCPKCGMKLVEKH